MKYRGPHYWQDRGLYPYHPLLAIARCSDINVLRVLYYMNKVKTILPFDKNLKCAISYLYQ